MSLSSHRKSDGGESVSMLSSNRPQRLSVASKRHSLTSPSCDPTTIEPLLHFTTRSTGVSSSRGARGHVYATDHPKPRGSTRAGSDTVDDSARKATLGKAYTRCASSVSLKAVAANSSFRTSREAHGVLDERARSSIFSLGSARSSERGRQSSAASAALIARHTTQRIRPHRLSTPVSRRTTQSGRSTTGSRADTAALTPELLALDPLPTLFLVPVTDAVVSENSIATGLAAPPTEGVLHKRTDEKEKKVHDIPNSRVDSRGCIRTPESTSSGEKVGTLSATQVGGDQEADKASEVPSEASVLLPVVSAADSAPSLVFHSRITDPAPHIDSVRRWRRVMRESSVASAPGGGADAVPVVALPPTVPHRPSSRSSGEQLGIATNAGEEASRSVVLIHAPLPSQHSDKQSTQVRSLSQSTFFPSALQTPLRSVPPSESGDRCISVLDTSQLNLSTASAGAQAVWVIPSALQPQLRSDSPLISERGACVVHRSSSAAKSPSVDAVMSSSTSAQEEPLAEKISIPGASQASTDAAHLSQDSRGASATTPPSSVGAAEPASSSRHRVVSDIEEEEEVVVGGGSAPMQPAPMRHLELAAVVSSTVSTASEGLLPVQHGTWFPPSQNSSASLAGEIQVVPPRGEEVSGADELSHDSHQSEDAFYGHELTNNTRATTGPEADEFSALTNSAEEHSVTREETEVKKMLGSSCESFRATATTGHASVTPRPCRRLEEDQKLDVELLRIATQASQPENVDLLCSTETLVGAGEQENVDRNEQQSLAGDTTRNAEDEVDAALVSESFKEQSPPVVASPSTSFTTPTARGSCVGCEGKPPLGDAGRVSVAAMERSGTIGSVALQRGPAKSADSPSGAKPPEASRTVMRSPWRTNGIETGSVSSVAGVMRSTSRGRAASEGASGAKFMRVLSCSALGGASQFLPTAARSGRVTTPAVESFGTGRDSRRRSSCLTVMTGGGTEFVSHTVLRRGDVACGSSSGGGPSPQKVSAVASEDLLPALFSAQEAANTITVVFDLDETLCNNRYTTGPILRPGAELLLHTLRRLCPSPRYKLIHTNARNQRVSNRLYDEAMSRMGMTPLYRSRVAQRQLANGHHRTRSSDLSGTVATSGDNASSISCATPSTGVCSTGEARPATANDANPLRLELVLWTASEESLARRAVRQIDPLNKIFDEAIYRDARWFRDLSYTKELSRLGRNMDRVVIIENSVDSVIRNRKNAILVTSFVRNRLDRQLFLVREVLLDWVRGMKATLATQQYIMHSAGALRESAERPTHRDVASHARGEDANGFRVGVPAEAGADGLVLPNSTPSLAHGGRGEGMASSTLHNGPALRGGGSSHDSLDGGVSLQGATSETEAPTPRQSSSPSGSGIGSSPRHAPRPLSAMDRRAPHIAEFLQHHHLILPFSNFLRFQLTDEVMMHLQATEPALIAAALPPPLASAEQTGARATRAVSSALAVRPDRSRCTSPITSSTSARPVTVATPTTVVPAGPASRALHTGSGDFVSPCGGPTIKEGGSTAASRLSIPGKEGVAGAAPASLPRGSSARTIRDSRCSCVMSNGVIRGADNGRDSVRLKRTSSAASTRRATNPL